MTKFVFDFPYKTVMSQVLVSGFTTFSTVSIIFCFLYLPHTAELDLRNLGFLSWKVRLKLKLEFA